MIRHRFFIAMLSAAVLASPALAKDYWVDQANPKASDKNPGTQELPLASISAAVKDLKPGDKVLIKAGEYREAVEFKASGTVDKPITIEAAEGNEGRVVILGSDRITNWKHTWGTNWQTAWKFDDDAHFPANWPEPDAYAKHREVVYVDGVPLKQCLAKGALLKGMFYLDAKEGLLRIALRDDQELKNVEVGVREFGFQATGNFLIIRGLKVMYCANSHHNSAMSVSGSDNLIENNQVLWNNMEGMHFAGSRLTIKGNVCNHNGRCGMEGAIQNSLMQDNITNANSWRYHGNWHDGGVKIIGGGPSNNRIIHHISCDNFSKGFWFDTDCRNNWIEGCIFDNNVESGLELEACKSGNWVVNNVFTRNHILHDGLTEQGTGGGIVLYETEGTHIVNNVFADNEGYGIVLAGGSRKAGDGGQVVTRDTVILNNIFTGNGIAALRLWVWGPSLEAMSSNHMDYNLFSPSQARKVAVRMDDQTRQQIWMTLEQWQSQRGQDKHSVAADPQFVDPARYDFRLLPGSPAIGAGTAVEKLGKGKTLDIGAHQMSGQ